MNAIPRFSPSLQIRDIVRPPEAGTERVLDSPPVAH